MRVWVRTEKLCIHFDGWKVSLDTWPIPLLEFKTILMAKVLEHIRESRCIFVVEDLNNVRNDPKEIARVLGERCRFFVQRGAANPVEVQDVDLVEFDDDVFPTLGDWPWSGGYDTEIISDESDDESTDWEEWLIEGKETFIFNLRFCRILTR